MSVNRSFVYSCNHGVRVKGGIAIGANYAFISYGEVAVNGGILVTPGMRVCATARPVSLGRHLAPIRASRKVRCVHRACTLPMAVRSNY